MSAEAPLPKPMTPPDLDLSSLEYMPLHVERLKRSVAWIKAKRNPELGFYLINLWTAAYMQTPAASLPADDDLLCDAAMCDPKRWPKVKEAVMRGFVRCADGRWYHRFVADIAHDALEKRLKWRKKKQGQREGRDGDIGQESSGVPRDVPSHVPGDKGGDRGGVGALRDGTGRDGTLNHDQQRSPVPAQPPPASIETKRKALALIERHFPNIRNDLRAYPALTSTQGLIESWLAEGADPERDVLPAIDGECIKLVAKNRPPRGFGWFAEAVAANRARNSAAPPGEAPAASENDAEIEAKLKARIEQRYAATGTWEPHWNWRPHWGARPDQRPRPAA